MPKIATFFNLKDHSAISKNIKKINELIQTETPAIVGETLDFMLYECSLDEAPAAEDVARWRDILRARGGKFLRLADLCQTWLDGEGA